METQWYLDELQTVAWYERTRPAGKSLLVLHLNISYRTTMGIDWMHLTEYRDLFSPLGTNATIPYLGSSLSLKPISRTNKQDLLSLNSTGR